VSSICSRGSKGAYLGPDNAFLADSLSEVEYMVDVVKSGEEDSSRQPNSPPLSAPHQQLSQLEVRVAAVENKLGAIRRSDDGWLKTAALLLGVFGGFIALPKALVETYDKIHPHPKTSVTAEKGLSVSYDPLERAIRFESDLLLRNDGTATDAIDRARANLIVQSNENSGEGSISEDDVQFSQGLSAVKPPVIQPGTPILVVISLLLPASRDNAIRLLNGPHRLDVTLHAAEDRKLSYCFDFDTEQAGDIVNAKPKRWANPKCEGSYAQ
jgi:hypothetical protein